MAEHCPSNGIKDSSLKQRPSYDVGFEDVLAVKAQ